jgi:hypothetical protein
VKDAVPPSPTVTGTVARWAVRVEQRNPLLLAVVLEKRPSASKLTTGVPRTCVVTSARKLRIIITAMCIRTIITITIIITTMRGLKRARARTI